MIDDRVFAQLETKKQVVTANRLLRMRSTFSKSVMGSVAVSTLGCTSTNFIFVELRAKINEQYYRDVLLMQESCYQRSAALLERRLVCLPATPCTSISNMFRFRRLYISSNVLCVHALPVMLAFVEHK